MKRKRLVRSGVVRGAHFRSRNYTSARQRYADNLIFYLRNFNIQCSYYEIPDDLEDCVDSRSYHQNRQIKNLRESYPSIFEPLSATNYVTRTQTLVFLEEIYNREQFESEDNQLFDCFVYYDELDDLYHVEGVPKTKRSIMIGGKISISCDDHFEYEGTIVEVYENGFSFDSKDDIDDECYDIQFLHSRTNTRKQLFSIGKVIQNLGFSFLFPTVKVFKPSFANRNMELGWFSSILNSFQKAAVKNIIHGYARPLPYIVFGPPGTGKTITLVESVCQVAALIEESVILVAAPSNRSADTITERLAPFLSSKNYLRLVSVNYFEKGLVPTSIKHCSVSVKDISQEVLKPFKVIIGTCSTLAGLHFHNLPPDYFSHVFVDEAGRCTEPEIMMPISLVSKESGQVILFGDPLQLGPMILSNLCKSPTANDRLERSFLERLMDLPLYQENGNHHDPHLVTKLIYNYR